MYLNKGPVPSILNLKFHSYEMFNWRALTICLCIAVQFKLEIFNIHVSKRIIIYTPIAHTKNRVSHAHNMLYKINISHTKCEESKAV